jgi:acyl-CoA synthetase (AMP-forming)/AMP-acid ligase II
VCIRDARAKLPSRASRLQAAKRHPQPQPSQLHREQDFGGKQLRRVNGISDQGYGKLRSVRANLAHFKAPHSVTFIEELPKMATGKIQKYVLRARQIAIAAQ